MANYKVDVSLIIPCFREGPTFEESVGKIVTVLNKTKYNWEIIFVEDKGDDETKSTVEKLTKKIKRSSAIYHKTNQGRGKSVTDGVMASKGRVCGFLDVDLEVSAEYIPLFIAEVENGADIAIGKRFYDQTSSSVLRFVASKIYALLVRLLINLPVSDTEAGYKFFNKKSITPILSKTRDKRWFWDTEICARAHFADLKISQIPILFVRRPEKKSTVRLIPDTWEYLVRLVQFRSEVAKLKKN